MFFKNLYTEKTEVSNRSEIYPLTMVPKLIKDEDNRKMIAPITSEEISKALHGMNPDKAPGPDGFMARFYIACWDIIQKYLVKMVRKS